MCDRFPRKFDVQTYNTPSNHVLGLIFVVNIKFPWATYHTIVPSTEELYYYFFKLSSIAKNRTRFALGKAKLSYVVISKQNKCYVRLSVGQRKIYESPTGIKPICGGRARSGP